MTTIVVDNIEYPIEVGPSNLSLEISDTIVVVYPQDTPTNVTVDETPVNVTVGDTSNVIYYAMGGVGISTTAYYGDSTPSTLYTLTALDCLDSIEVYVENIFDGIGSYITIGTTSDPERFFSSTDVDLSLDSTTFTKDFTDQGPYAVLLFIHPGMGPSSGKLQIQVKILPKG